MFCTTKHTNTTYCWSHVCYCSVSLSTSLQYIVDPVIMNILYHCLHHYNIVLIPWLLMFFITFYTITIYCWSCDYEYPVSLSTSLRYIVDAMDNNVLYVSLSTTLQYIVDPTLINFLYHCAHHYSILLIQWLLMFCITVYSITIYYWSHDYYCSVSMSTSLQFIADRMLMTCLYHFLHHYNILLIPWLLMLCNTVHTITIYC